MKGSVVDSLPLWGSLLSNTLHLVTQEDSVVDALPYWGSLFVALSPESKLIIVIFIIQDTFTQHTSIPVLRAHEQTRHCIQPLRSYYTKWHLHHLILAILWHSSMFNSQAQCS